MRLTDNREKTVKFEQLIQNLDADIYQRLRTAVELGKWANGEALTAQQKEISIQAMIAYERIHFPPEQRTGYIEPKPSRGEGRNNASACGHKEDDAQEDVPLRWE